MRTSTFWLSAGIALITMACAAERDELRYKRPKSDEVASVTSAGHAPPAAPSRSPAPLPAAPIAERPEVEPTPTTSGAVRPGDGLVDDSPVNGTAATTSAREAARRAAAAHRTAESAARAAQAHLEATSQATRQVDGSSAAASASRAEQEARQAESAAREAESRAAEAHRAAEDASASAPEGPAGERLRRQSRDAASHAASSAQQARRAANSARSSAQEAAAAVEIVARLTDEQRRLRERMEEERARALEADSESSQAADAAEEAALRATRAADELRSPDVEKALSDARQETARARAAARQLQDLASSAAAVTSDPASAPGEGRDAATSPAAQAAAELSSQGQQHARWLADLAAIAADRLARVEAAEERVGRLGDSDFSSTGTAALPTVPALPPERRARPSGVMEPERADLPPVPDVGRFTQVAGGNAPDWLPGGYVECRLTLRVDDIVEVTRVFPAHLEITWRAGYRWSEDRRILVVGEDEKTRPAAGTLLGFEGGPSAAATPLPVSLTVERLPDGALRLAGKTYAPAD